MRCSWRQWARHWAICSVFAEILSKMSTEFCSARAIPMRVRIAMMRGIVDLSKAGPRLISRFQKFLNWFRHVFDIKIMWGLAKFRNQRCGFIDVPSHLGFIIDFEFEWEDFSIGRRANESFIRYRASKMFSKREKGLNCGITGHAIETRAQVWIDILITVSVAPINLLFWTRVSIAVKMITLGVVSDHEWMHEFKGKPSKIRNKFRI